jgi:hypothetical protein
LFSGGNPILNKLIKFGSVCSILLIISVVFIGCSSSVDTTTTPMTSTATTVTPNADEAAVRAYADPITITTLQGLGENNLAKYTGNASAAFKAALTQAAFDKTASQINSQLGSFESIIFLRLEKQGVYTVVHYTAKYAKGNQGIRMVFDQDHLVAGQWFE